MKPHSSNPLPALLRYFRQKAGLTQQDVAAALSISRSGYANYEEGRNIPNIEQAINCQSFSTTIFYTHTPCHQDTCRGIQSHCRSSWRTIHT